MKIKMELLDSGEVYQQYESKEMDDLMSRADQVDLLQCLKNTADHYIALYDRKEESSGE